MGGGLHPVELLFERPVRVVADQDVDAVAVEGQGHAMRHADLAEYDRVAMQVLGRPKRHAHDRARRVIDRSDQREGGSALLEPGKRAGVDLNQGAHGVGRRPALSAPDTAAASLRRDSQFPTDSPNARPADVQRGRGWVVLEHVGQMTVVEPAVRRLQQLTDVRADHLRETARGGALPSDGSTPQAPRLETASSAAGIAGP
jgi:hypothetical protein